MQTNQTIRRNFPVLGNTRYLLEMIRPEIRKYFVEGDNEAVPYSRSRAQRKIVYERTKGLEYVLCHLAQEGMLQLWALSG